MTQATKGDSIAELLALFPQPEVVAQGGVSLSIPVLNFGQIAKVMKIVGPIFAGANPEQQWQELVASNADRVLEVLSIALEKPIEYIGAMPGDLAGKAFLALYKVNADFFKSRILPLMSDFQNAGAATAGPTS